MISPPAADEANEYYHNYISQVPPGDILSTLDAQGAEFAALLRSIPEARSTHRYAADKWTIREVVNHVNDTERVFVFRALWFARGFDSPLPAFDQNVAVAGAAVDHRSWDSLVKEFTAVRGATVALFATLADEAWDRRGIASGYSFTVRALAYITAGHVAHHAAILRGRYL